MAPLHWGIAASGRISNDFCAALSSCSAEHHQVVAVAARSLSSAQEFAERFNIPKYYDGYEKLATDDEVDAVYIGAINTTHYEIAVMLLSAGKHVLCEKPLTLNEKHSRKLLEHAKANKRLCVEAIWSRFFPSYQYLRNRLDKKDLGDVKEVEVDLGILLEDIERISKKSLGGGTVLDLGVYTIQISQFVFDEEPISIRAKGVLNDEGVDVSTEVEMTYPSGGVAKFRTSAVTEMSNRAIIRGTKGSITLSDFFACTHLTDIDSKIKEWPLPKHRIGHFEFPNSCGLRYEAEEFRRCIGEGLIECPIVTHEDSLRMARIRDEIRRQIGVKFDEDYENFDEDDEN